MVNSFMQFCTSLGILVITLVVEVLIGGLWSYFLLDQFTTPNGRMSIIALLVIHVIYMLFIWIWMWERERKGNKE